MEISKEELEKIKRSQKLKFLNTSPISSENDQYNWNIIGIGITEENTEYNPTVSEDPWIILDNPDKTIDGYNLSASQEQTAFKGDPVFEYVDDIRYFLKTGKDAETQLLEVDKYNVSTEDGKMKFRARLWDVAISVSSDGGSGGEGSKISYTYNYKGDPIFGTVSFENKKPVFTETV